MRIRRLQGFSRVSSVPGTFLGFSDGNIIRAIFKSSKDVSKGFMSVSGSFQKVLGSFQVRSWSGMIPISSLIFFESLFHLFILVYILT